MAVLINVPKPIDFEFQLKKGGKVLTLPSFSRFPIARTLAQSDMTPEQIVMDYAAYVVEQCPELAEADSATIGMVITAWQAAAGVTPGE